MWPPFVDSALWNRLKNQKDFTIVSDNARACPLDVSFTELARRPSPNKQAIENELLPPPYASIQKKEVRKLQMLQASRRTTLAPTGTGDRWDCGSPFSEEDCGTTSTWSPQTKLSYRHSFPSLQNEKDLTLLDCCSTTRVALSTPPKKPQRRLSVNTRAC